MKLIFSLTFILALYGTAAALQCLNCTDQTCSNTASQTCASETMCISATILASQSGTTATRIYKACASSSLCPVTGNGTFSVELANQSAIADALCCNTDDCNSGTQPSPTTPSPNSLQCISCDPTTSQCTPITCSGEQNNCFTATLTDGANSFPVLGCATQSTCQAAPTLGSLPFMENIGSVSSGPECCTTSLCNDPRTTTTAAPTTTTQASPTTTTTAAPTTTTTAAPTTTTTAAPTTTTTAAPTTTTTAAPTTTTTAAPTTTTTAAPTTTTTAAPTTTTTAAPTTTTTAAPTTTTTAAPTTTTTAAPTTTTTAAPTTTTTAAPTTTTTTAPTTTTTSATATITTTTTSNASCIRLSLFHLLFGFFMFFIYKL